MREGERGWVKERDGKTQGISQVVRSASTRRWPFWYLGHQTWSTPAPISAAIYLSASRPAQGDLAAGWASLCSHSRQAMGQTGMICIQCSSDHREGKPLDK